MFNNAMKDQVQGEIKRKKKLVFGSAMKKHYQKEMADQMKKMVGNETAKLRRTFFSNERVLTQVKRYGVETTYKKQGVETNFAEGFVDLNKMDMNKQK